MLRAICDQHGIVYVADEIQTGFGRTGRYFCSEYTDVEPDLMTSAKGIASARVDDVHTAGIDLAATFDAYPEFEQP